jgi:anaerobic selenocysteine-containing dehydrogenase
VRDAHHRRGRPGDARGGGSGSPDHRRVLCGKVSNYLDLFLNSTFANQRRQRSAQPRPELVIHPDDAAPRGIEDGARVRVLNDRGEFRCIARVSDDARAGVAVAPMGWWNHDYEGGRSSQATTSQELTVAGNAPIFNDNRAEVEPIRG